MTSVSLNRNMREKQDGPTPESNSILRCILVCVVSRNNWVQKYFWSKKDLLLKICWVRKKCWVQNRIGAQKKIFVQQIWVSERFSYQKNYWSTNILGQTKKIGVSKDFELQIFWVQKICVGKKLFQKNQIHQKLGLKSFVQKNVYSRQFGYKNLLG